MDTARQEYETAVAKYNRAKGSYSLVQGQLTKAMEAAGKIEDDKKAEDTNIQTLEGKLNEMAQQRRIQQRPGQKLWYDKYIRR